MQLRLKRLRLHVDWLMLLLPIIASALGEGRQTAMLLLSLTLHESAHCLAARALKVSFRSLRLTPFGGLAEIDNPYALSALQLCAVSIAGPAANLLALVVSAALCHWNILSPASAAGLISVNATLMLFNLLPALPLDGGRMLYAVLSLWIPRHRAAEAGIFLGRMLAALLAAFSLWGFCTRGILNLSPLIAALFLLSSARDERHALTDSRVRSLIDSLRPMDAPLPAAVIAIDEQTPPEIALRSAAPGRITLFAVFQNGRFKTFLDDRTLIAALSEGSALQNQKSQKK